MTTEAADPVDAAAIAPAADAGFLQRWGTEIEYILIPGAALVAALVLFGIFVALFGKNPLDLYWYMYYGAFGTWFSWQNTLTRAAPLILTALCTALPAQLGMVIIGGEGALLIGALAATCNRCRREILPKSIAVLPSASPRARASRLHRHGGASVGIASFVPGAVGSVGELSP